MNRHGFRWSGVVFGSFLLIVAGAWTVWQTDLLTPREFNVTLSIVLMVAGVLGVVATFATRSTAPTNPDPSPQLTEEPDEQATDSQH